jgi:DNA repair protein RadC
MATLHSSTPIKTREDRAIYRALSILKTRLREPDGEAFASTSSVRDYLRLLLADEEREVFAVLYLDAQNRLIEAETPFHGTLTQTSVYPREVVKRALHYNAAAVIFAHNHPSGVAEPSRADMLLTCALKEALALVEVNVLDHFIVAGHCTLSFVERGILGMREVSQEKPAAPAKRRVRQRKEAASATV